MMTRYSLRYRTHGGSPITLHNLGAVAVREVVQAQAGLGSSQFEKREQTAYVSDAVSTLLRGSEWPDELFYGPWQAINP